MQTIKVAAPAKINLTLEVLDKRDDGFHNIKSVMQAINLYDYLSFRIMQNKKTEIQLTGNSKEIPYDERNLVHKAILKFIEKTKLLNYKIEVYIEKNIPIEAGLAGGSTDAAATLFALNNVFNNILNNTEIEEICSSLGSDLNFCLYGGTSVCTGRGENIEKIQTTNKSLSLIKPIGFGISAKEAYMKFSNLKNKEIPNNTEKIIKKFSEEYLYNSLENAVIDDYKELQEIKKKVEGAIMSGSGPTFFVLKPQLNVTLDEKRFLKFENLKFIEDGAKIVN